jgi:hypothetical protein
VDSFEAVIERYGSPHLWGGWEWFLNFWRLLGEYVEIRAFIDVALRCPDAKVAKLARDKFSAEFDLEHLDTTWPGRGCFTYDWEGLTRVNDMKEKCDGD